LSVRVNQRWPDGLKERIEAEAGKSNVTDYTVRALEAALEREGKADPEVAATLPEDQAEPSPGLTANRTGPAPPRAPTVAVPLRVPEPPASAVQAFAESGQPAVRYRCKVPDCKFTAGSPKAFCGSHPGTLVQIS
jgi:hypothetical protein